MPENESVQDLWRGWRAERQRLVAPTLLRYEVTNAVHRLGLANPAECPGLRRGMESVVALPIELYGDPWLPIDALEFAERFHMQAAYDAHYLALAQRLGCQLWTADRRLFNSVGSALPWERLVAS